MTHNSVPASQNGRVYIHAVNTALPEHALNQSEILAFMQRHSGESPERNYFLRRVYEGSAIDRRYSVLADYRRAWEDFSFYPRSPDLEPSPKTAERNAVFAVEAEALALHAVSTLFFPRADNGTASSDPGRRVGNTRLNPGDITHLITHSCTGFSAPGFDLGIQKRLLRDDVHRIHIGFMGCYAAFPALKTATAICKADPAAKVLIVGVELCTLHFQKRWEPDLVVANALFGDGAAAVLISADPADSFGEPLYELIDFASRVIGGSENEMAWIIGDTGFEMKLSSYVPKVIEANIDEILDGLLERNGISRASISSWAVHPGGRAIIDRLGASLGLDHEALRHSYGILREFGNMSSVTIFFVLAGLIQDLLRQRAESVAIAGLSRERIQSGPWPGAASTATLTGPPAGDAGLVFSAAFGPGLTVESAVLRALPATGFGSAPAATVWPLSTAATAAPPSHKAPKKPSQNGRQPWLFPRLKKRSYETELMDMPDADPVKLKRTIEQFSLLNRLFSASSRILGKEIFDRIRILESRKAATNGTGGKVQPASAKTWTVLDIGAGGGDIARWLVLEAKRRSVKIRVLCIDQDDRIVRWASEACAGYTEIEVRQAGADEIGALEDVDFAICNHVLHHLDEPAIMNLLRIACAKTRVNMVFNDLRRSWWAYVGYTIFTGLFVRGSFAFYDGRLSIRRGFKRNELETLIAAAGLKGTLDVATGFPARLYIKKAANDLA